jgi:hypothetical protein
VPFVPDPFFSGHVIVENALGSWHAGCSDC